MQRTSLAQKVSDAFLIIILHNFLHKLELCVSEKQVSERNKESIFTAEKGNSSAKKHSGGHRKSSERLL